MIKQLIINILPIFSVPSGFSFPDTLESPENRGGPMKTLARLSLVAVLAFGLATGLLANGLNLNGFGARATGMGGAYVSLANDYTAVFWNPAGLAEMAKAQFGLDFDALYPTGKYSLGSFTMKTEKKLYPAGLAGYVQPIGKNIVVGL